MPTAQVDLEMDTPRLARSALITHLALALGCKTLVEKEGGGPGKGELRREEGLAHLALESDR